MSKPIKKSSPRGLKLVKLLCENCGEVIEVPLDSECWHCGVKLVRDVKWRHRK